MEPTVNILQFNLIQVNKHCCAKISTEGYLRDLCHWGSWEKEAKWVEVEWEEDFPLSIFTFSTANHMREVPLYAFRILKHVHVHQLKTLNWKTSPDLKKKN